MADWGDDACLGVPQQSSAERLLASYCLAPISNS